MLGQRDIAKNSLNMTLSRQFVISDRHRERFLGQLAGALKSPREEKSLCKPAQLASIAWQDSGQQRLF